MTESESQDAAEASTYELIRQRLKSESENLWQATDQLNQERIKVFGAKGMELGSTSRILTPNACKPRDMIFLGNKLLVGYEVFIGMKATTSIGDLFAVYQTEDGSEINVIDINQFLGDKKFKGDFEDLFKFYKNVRFSTFQKNTNSFLMVFTVGEQRKDKKVLKWNIDPSGNIQYDHNRAEQEYKYPPQHEFHWKDVGRDQHVYGSHPHITIEDRVFVDCVGGDLTIKVEDNTESGVGIYAEPVEEKDQSLDDCKISYSILGHLILLRITPYREEASRYLVYNEQTGQVARIDDIQSAGILLPENNGVIFPKGYYLASGTVKNFNIPSTENRFRELKTSPNGEDFLYIFYDAELGEYILLPFNIIRKEIDAPILCHGYALMNDGRLLVLRNHQEPQKTHPIQIWDTPFVSDTSYFKTDEASPLSKIGNPALVRGIGDIKAIFNLCNSEEVTVALYESICRDVDGALDSHFWLSKQDSPEVVASLNKVKDVAARALGEYEKVVELKKSAKVRLHEAQKSAKEFLDNLSIARFEGVNDYVAQIAELRKQIGHVMSLMDVRYIDVQKLEEISTELKEKRDTILSETRNFLLDEKALAPYYQELSEHKHSLEGLNRVRDLKEAIPKLEEMSEHTNLLIELISQLGFDDAEDASRIVENVSQLIGEVNQVRAMYRAKYETQAKQESSVEFLAQFKLIDQTLTGLIDQANTPADCDAGMATLISQVEDLESRFAEFDEYLEKLSEKRETVYNAFSQRKMQIEQKIQKRVSSLVNSSERILKSVSGRIERLKTIEELNAYFASDVMIEKLFTLIDEMKELGATVQAEDVAAKLKELQKTGNRQIQDKSDLFEGDVNAIKFGEFRFLVNAQPFDLAIVEKEGKGYYHLTSTEYYEEIEDSTLSDNKHLWGQDLVSETSTFSRAEFLAYQFFAKFGQELFVLEQEELESKLREFMASRPTEGYEKGVHDHDAILILKTIGPILQKAGLLLYAPNVRALGLWILMQCEQQFIDSKIFEALLAYAPIDEHGKKITPSRLLEETIKVARGFVEKHPLFKRDDLTLEASKFIFDLILSNARQAYLSAPDDFSYESMQLRIPVSAEAKHFLGRFERRIETKDFGARLNLIFKQLESHPGYLKQVLKDWMIELCEVEKDEDLREEIAYFALTQKWVEKAELFIPDGVSENLYSVTVEGLLSRHSRIEDQKLTISIPDFLFEQKNYANYGGKLWREFQDAKHQHSVNKREELKLDELKPKIMSGFVRNRLINEVYFPLVGANLAKQMGAYGENKRTDLMGLLLLISPPGYGKTTLMEYLADRLGLIFMKINGPAIGHEVSSVDPEDAPNATAKNELIKLNMSFEMGTNIMIYLDDIQHCNPEFLQKFISLCDGQRKIEGVWKGRSKTYDFRGKRVAVVMAGNPYTESGDKFRIPDMLSNRADVYNLGDMLGSARDAFISSYIENAMTSHPVLASLASKGNDDVLSVIKSVSTPANMTAEVELKSHTTNEELEEYQQMIRKLIQVRDVILKVNAQYIDSAGQEDKYRKEPSFLLQGSYRNMNRIVEKILPIMDDEELVELIEDHYRYEAQLLTSGAEFNFLRFREMTNRLTEEEKARLQEVREEYLRIKRTGGDEDAVQKLVSQADILNSQFSNLVDVLRTSES